MMYGSLDVMRDGQGFLSFWTIFSPLTRLSIQKINILKKREKRPGDIIILHVSTITENHMMYAS